MKTKITLLGVMLLMAFMPVKAQVGGSPSGYIALYLGTGYPLSDFGSTDANNSYAGYAQVGYNFGASYAFPIKHSNWGISAKIDYIGNSFDVQSFVNNIAASANTGSVWEAQTMGNWSAATILVGGFATIPVNRFSFDFRAMGGVMFATIPTILVATDYTDYSTGNEVSEAYGINTTNGTSFAYDFGVGLRYSCSKHFGIMLNFDYLGANPSFTATTGYIVTVNNIQTQNESPSTLNQSISLFNATFGIGYQF